MIQLFADCHVENVEQEKKGKERSSKQVQARGMWFGVRQHCSPWVAFLGSHESDEAHDNIYMVVRSCDKLGKAPWRAWLAEGP